jgi:putative two-component system response regulator
MNTPITTDQRTILAVDDTPDNLEVLRGTLRQHFKVKVALNGEKALQIANALPRPDMILLDVMMPGLDGYEVCRRLKENPSTADIPVIFITAQHEIKDEQLGFELGAVDYISKPISPPIVQARVQTHLAMYDQNRELERRVTERTFELNETRLKVVQKLGRAGEYKDNETGMHAVRMSHYARLMAEALGYSDKWSDLVFNAAPMHDIGKIGIPDKILLKPGKLDAEEWEEMKRHAQYGAEIIGDEDNDLLRMAAEVAITHHEKWDGSGYPNGLKGKDIPLTGRIVAIADVFDALTSARPYKKAWSVEDAVNLIREETGLHFDPELVPIFERILPEVLVIKAQYLDEEDT